MHKGAWFRYVGPLAWALRCVAIMESFFDMAGLGF